MSRRTTSFAPLLAVILVATCSMHAHAWGPNTHMYWTLRSLDEAGDTPITRVIHENIDAFYCGLMAPDVSVIYYYSSFESYKSTHSWSFLNELSKLAKTDAERAFVHGVAVHMVQDSISHNYYIPRKIQGSHVMNDLIHPLVEGLVETQYLTPETMGSMMFIEDYIGLVNEATGRQWNAEARLLKMAIAGGSFYRSSYSVPEGDWLWRLYNGLAGFARDRVDVSDSEVYLEMARQRTVSYLKSGVTPPLDPSGSQALAEADRGQMAVTWAIRLALFLPVTVLVYLKMGRKKT
jgi:hypothetical protein